MSEGLGLSVSPLVKRLQNRYRRISARYLSRRPFAINPPLPIVSFTFDDFPRSALLTGGAILQSFGVAGTYYVSLGLAGKQTETGSIFLPDDLKVLVAYGHELGCHTFSHCDAWCTQPDSFEEAILKNSRTLAQLMPGTSFKTMSYPINGPRARTKRISSRYFACCRGGGQTSNIGQADLNYLSAYFLEQGRDNPGAIKDLIDHNSQAPGWLIFATHDICDEPTRWGCTPNFFKDIVAYAINSGAQIFPVAKAYETLCAASPCHNK